MPFWHNNKAAHVQVEFKYYPRKNIHDEDDIMEVNNGATFVVLEETQFHSLHAVFVYGVDEENKEYIVLDSMRDRRDEHSRRVNGVKKPNQRVPWYVQDPNTGRLSPSEVVIVQITRVYFKEGDYDLRRVPFFEKNQVKPLPKGEHSPAYTREIRRRKEAENTGSGGLGASLGSGGLLGNM